MNTEAQINRILSEIRANKASAPTAASNVKTYVQTSQSFMVQGEEKPRFRFTPNYGMGRTQLITLRSVVLVNGELSDANNLFVNEPQDGSGNVDIQVQFFPYDPSQTYEVKIIASGTSTGSFAVLQ